MSIISKICVLFLAWMVVGALRLIGTLAIGMIKIYIMERKLGLSNKEFQEDMNYLSGGKDTLEDHSDSTWFDVIGGYLLAGLIWPVTLAAARQLARERLTHIESRRNSKESGKPSPFLLYSGSHRLVNFYAGKTCLIIEEGYRVCHKQALFRLSSLSASSFDAVACCSLLRDKR